MLRIAKERRSVLQLELEFVEGNTRARALYEKMGFKITGVRPDAIRLKDGTLLDEYMMVRKIFPLMIGLRSICRSRNLVRGVKW